MRAFGAGRGGRLARRLGAQVETVQVGQLALDHRAHLLAHFALVRAPVLLAVLVEIVEALQELHVKYYYVVTTCTTIEIHTTARLSTVSEKYL